jgi:hypothetical protein
MSIGGKLLTGVDLDDEDFEPNPLASERSSAKQDEYALCEVVTHYMVASAFSPEKLHTSMQELLSMGWQPLGSLQVASYRDNKNTMMLFSQALVKTKIIRKKVVDDTEN